MPSFEDLPKDSVVLVEEDAPYLLRKMFTIQEMLEAVKVSSIHSRSPKWLGEGASGKILSPNSDWIAGKIKITIEFIPDDQNSDPELEKLRQQIL